MTEAEIERLAAEAMRGVEATAAGMTPEDKIKFFGIISEICELECDKAECDMD